MSIPSSRWVDFIIFLKSGLSFDRNLSLFSMIKAAVSLASLRIAALFLCFQQDLHLEPYAALSAHAVLSDICRSWASSFADHIAADRTILTGGKVSVAYPSLRNAELINFFRFAEQSRHLASGHAGSSPKPRCLGPFQILTGELTLSLMDTTKPPVRMDFCRRLWSKKNESKPGTANVRTRTA